MFGFFKKMFTGLLSVCAIGSLGESLASKGPIKCVSLNNLSCKVDQNINSDETLFYPFAVRVNKCGGGCNTIDDPYARVCVTNKLKNMNVKIFNLISRVNETRFLVQRESRECKCIVN